MSFYNVFIIPNITSSAQRNRLVSMISNIVKDTGDTGVFVDNYHTDKKTFAVNIADDRVFNNCEKLIAPKYCFSQLKNAFVETDLELRLSIFSLIADALCSCDLVGSFLFCMSDNHIDKYNLSELSKTVIANGLSFYETLMLKYREDEYNYPPTLLLQLSGKGNTNVCF